MIVSTKYIKFDDSKIEETYNEEDKEELRKFFDSPKVKDLINENKWQEFFDSGYIDNISVSNATPFLLLAGVPFLDGVKRIAVDMFAGGTYLISITIPDGVEIIDSYAFANCNSLTSVIIPDGVKEIGIGAFNDCTSLTSITIPDSVEIIKTDAFFNCPKIKIYYNGTKEQWNKVETWLSCIEDKNVICKKG